MLQLSTPPPSVLPGFDDPDLPAGARVSDAALMALSLFTVWAVRTGRTLRPVPIADLTAQEIEAFWADDQLDDFSRSAPR